MSNDFNRDDDNDNDFDDDNDYDDDDDDDNDYDDYDDDDDDEEELEFEKLIKTFSKFKELIHDYHMKVSFEILKMLPTVQNSEQSITTLLPRCTTKRPSIPNDVKETILKEIQIAYTHKNAISYFGNYYEQLLRFGFQLDVFNDKNLLNRDLSDPLNQREDYVQWTKKVLSVPNSTSYCYNPACKYSSLEHVLGTPNDPSEPAVSRIKVKQCSRCQSAYYCSPECQKTHWKQHKYHCRSS